MTSKIVEQARTWLGTPFKHQGRVKHIGCDCIGFVVGVVSELGLCSGNGKLLSSYDEVCYGRIPDGKMLKNKLESCLFPIKIKDIQEGDLLLLRFRKEPQHVAIISNYEDNEFAIIHCYAESGKVVEHRLDDLWKSRIVSAYRLTHHSKKHL